MIADAREISQEAGKSDGLTHEQITEISTTVGLGALKYFILKVDPKKTMLFDPKESIDFNGNTGPFIQYTHARICSVLRRTAAVETTDELALCSAEEIELIKLISLYPSVVKQGAENFSPAVIASYAYDLAKSYNGYYHDHPILREENIAVRTLRIELSRVVARTISSAMSLLGITLPERM